MTYLENTNITEKYYQSTLLNIDSAYRNINPKHIYISNNNTLDNNPLYFTKNSSTIQIKCNNHNFNIGDNIILQNVEGIHKILYKSFYLINNCNYLLINFKNNYLLNAISNKDLYCNIEIVNSQIEQNLIDNIPINNILGIKQLYKWADIIDKISKNCINIIYLITQSIYENITDDVLNTNFIFIKLDRSYINQNNNNYVILNQMLKISYLHIYGIKIGYINANYPINNYNYQNNHTITNIINENMFEINISFLSYNDGYGGGSNIKIYKILNSIDGYPNVDDYTIHLKKSFNNVSSIELVSIELPYVDLIIKKNINDKLYWKNINDGDYIYSIQLDEGFYTTNTLIDSIKLKMNNTKRIITTTYLTIYNIFDISFDINTHTTIFYSYDIIKIPNGLSIRLIKLNDESYYILNVNHPNNIIEVDDIVYIDNAIDITIKDDNNFQQIKSIDSQYINKNHKVYNINTENQTYDIILGKTSEITSTLVNYDSAGGENITIKFKTKVSFLFNKSDTLGEILGWKNVGDIYSITEFKSEISNKDNYIYTFNLDSVGNEITYNNGFINLSGKYNYILMYLNDIEYIYSSGNLPSAFSKILLSGNPGDILFNTHVIQPDNIYSKSFPITTLTDIKVKFLYPDGNKVNFRNVNHSFTLKIVEERIYNKK